MAFHASDVMDIIKITHFLRFNVHNVLSPTSYVPNKYRFIITVWRELVPVWSLHHCSGHISTSADCLTPPSFCCIVKPMCGLESESRDAVIIVQYNLNMRQKTNPYVMFFRKTKTVSVQFSFYHTYQISIPLIISSTMTWSEAPVDKIALTFLHANKFSNCFSI